MKSAGSGKMPVNYLLSGCGLAKRGLDQGLGHHRERAQGP